MEEPKKKYTKPKNIRQSELVKMILTLTNVQRAEVEKILSAIADVIKSEIVKGNAVRIPRVGSFYLKRWKVEENTINGRKYNRIPRVFYTRANCLRNENLRDIIDPKLLEDMVDWAKYDEQKD